MRFWIEDVDSLKGFALHPLIANDKEKLVCDFITEFGTWNIKYLHCLLPIAICDKIIALPPPQR